MNSDKNILKKLVDDFCKEAKQIIEIIKCPICGKDGPRLCNSHSVPEFVLVNISKGLGTVDYVLGITRTGIEKKNLGKGQAGCFRLICKDCDSLIFKDYEGEEKLLKFENPQRITRAIALKNVLKNMHGQLEQLTIYNSLLEKNKVPKKDISLLEQYCQVCISDLDDYHKDMLRIEDMLCGDNISKFRIIYNEHLNYVVPLAFQGCFRLVYDLEGKYINISNNEFLPLLHIAVLALKNSSIVIMYTHESNSEYEEFINQFESKEIEEKLQIVNYLIFKYSDNYFISKKIDNKLYTSAFVSLCIPKKADLQTNEQNVAIQKIIE